MVSDESTIVRLKTIDAKFPIPKDKPEVTDKEAYIKYMMQKLSLVHAKFFLIKELYGV